MPDSLSDDPLGQEGADAGDAAGSEAEAGAEAGAAASAAPTWEQASEPLP